MSEEQKNIEIAKQEFSEKARNLEKLMKFQEDFFEYLLKIKLAFLTFNGVIISIVFANKEYFSYSFLLWITVILVILFILLAIELILKFKDMVDAIKKQQRITMLAKIRHIAIMRSRLNKYGERSEELLIQEDKIEQKMLNGESITEIIKCSRNWLTQVVFIIWLIALVGTPVLFLFEILGKLT